jgi:hypothetical protein
VPGVGRVTQGALESHFITVIARPILYSFVRRAAIFIDSPSGRLT